MAGRTGSDGGERRKVRVLKKKVLHFLYFWASIKIIGLWRSLFFFFLPTLLAPSLFISPLQFCGFRNRLPAIWGVISPMRIIISALNQTSYYPLYRILLAQTVVSSTLQQGAQPAAAPLPNSWAPENAVLESFASTRLQLSEKYRYRYSF